MDLSWTCRPPAVDLALQRRSGRGSNIPVTSASAGRESLSDEGFQAEDRHNPLPYIGPYTTALN